MSEHIPDIETYVKRLNWYLQEHYPANKKITAEEWNALFLALMNQGNLQEDTLAQICNELLPIQVAAINDLIDITTNHESRVTSLESTVANHGQRITGLETLTQNHEQRLDTLEPIVSDHGERIEDLENLTQVHERRLDVLEPIVTDHGERVEYLESIAADHSALIDDLRFDVDSNTNRIEQLEFETTDKPYRIETVLKYNVSNIPQGIVYAKDGKKDLLIEFFNETFTVPLSETTTGSRKGAVIVVDKVTDTTTNRTTQTEVFYFKEGVATRQVIYDETTGSTITMSDWSAANNGFFQSLRASITENANEILGIKRDYATKSELDTAKTNLQTQVTANRTDLNTILPDYVKKSDNTNIDYLTRNELSVSDTGALIQTESLKNITTGTTSAPRQTTPIPVVDNKARLFLPQEIASLRDLVDWKTSLLGEAINFIVSYADIPEDPTPAQLQIYLNNKWASIGGTTPIIDQTTMTDEDIPLSYRWYVNENKWIYTRGDTGTRATNNIYDEHGTLITPGARGTTVGSNLKFHVMYETNGEGAVVGLDALEETVINNSADISGLRTDLTNYETSNDTEVSNLKTRATDLETRATTLEGLIPTKVDKISNTLNMQAVYGLNSSGVHNLTGVANATTGNTLVLRDADGRAHITAPTANTHIANKSYVDSADSTLQSNLTNEATARANADSTLQDNIDAEAAARSSADSTMQTNITSLTNNKMDKANPTGTGSLSLNRKAGTTVGTNSVTLGNNNTASNNCAFAGGDSSTASGQHSMAYGSWVEARGFCSFGAGGGNIASANYASVLGNGNESKGRSQFVFGEYNVADTNSDASQRSTHIEIVGKGSNGAPSNARTLDWYGNEYLAGNLQAAGLTDGTTTKTMAAILAKVEFVENTTGSADPSPLADYYNKSAIDTKLSAYSNTVQIANNYYNKTQIDNSLNQKVNLNLTNINPTRTSTSLTINGIAGIKRSGAHICIESWVSNDKSYGYRIYDDGYCKQWGKELTLAAGTYTITLLKAMSNTKYTVLATYANESTELDISNGAISVGDKTTSNFKLRKWSSDGVNWKAYGYIN